MPIEPDDTIPEILWREMRWLEEHVSCSATSPPEQVEDREASLHDPAEPGQECAAVTAPRIRLTLEPPSAEIAPQALPAPRLRHCAECQEQTASCCVTCGRPLCGDHQPADCSGCRADASARTRRVLLLACWAAVGLSVAGIVGAFGMLAIVARGWLAGWPATTFALVSGQIAGVMFCLVFVVTGVAELIKRRRVPRVA